MDFAFYQRTWSTLLLFDYFGIASGVMLTSGEYKSMLTTHIRHFYVYAKRISFQHPDAQLRNPFTSDTFVKLFKFLSKGYYREFFNLIERDVVNQADSIFPCSHVTCLILLIINFEFIT